MRLLLVEDEESLRTITAKRLSGEGYSVDACADGEDALVYLAAAEYDAVILDILLPKRDGLSVLRQMRSERNATPVLLLTALGTVHDRGTGLDCGADDYLVKPFAFEELLARVRALLRRQSANPGADILTLGDLSLDIKARTAVRAGCALSLSQKEFSVLEYLMRNRGVVLSRDKIGQHIWNYDYEGASNVIDVYIRCLRKKVDADFDQKLIHTVRGVGYVVREE